MKLKLTKLGKSEARQIKRMRKMEGGAMREMKIMKETLYQQEETLYQQGEDLKIAAQVIKNQRTVIELRDLWKDNTKSVNQKAVDAKKVVGKYIAEEGLPLVS